MRIFYFLVFFFSIHQAWAITSCNEAYSVTSSVTIPNVTVPRDTLVGTKIAEATATSTGFYGMYCTNPITLSSLLVYSSTLSNYKNNVYDTSVPGIGIRFGQPEFEFDNPATITKFNSTTGHLQYCCGTAELVVTGKIESGRLNSGTLAKLTFLGYDNKYHLGVTISLISSPIITVSACQVQTSSLSFPIGAVPVDQFVAVGTISQQVSTQNLGLNCDSGTNITVTLNGTKNTDMQDDSVLALNPVTDTAKGIGVQLLYNNQPLKIGTPLQMKVSTGGQETFPLTARYIQTKDSVTPGHADATAVLNIIYQ